MITGTHGGNGARRPSGPVGGGEAGMANGTDDAESKPRTRARPRNRVPESAVDALIDLRLRELGKENISISGLEREHGMRAGLLAYALRKENRGRVPTAASVNAWATALECDARTVSRAFAEDLEGVGGYSGPQRQMLILMETLDEDTQRYLVQQAELFVTYFGARPPES
jgi:hypothetical protein